LLIAPIPPYFKHLSLFPNIPQRENNFGRAGELRYSIIPSLEEKLPKDGESIAKTSEEGTLIHESVTADDIAAVVSRVTGIPVTKLTSGHAERLIHMEDTLRSSVRGQDEALKAVANAVRMQRAGLNGENRPLASFFFLGPTGVGKTELCKKMASFLFSTESAVLRFDMSEFQEKHTISRLIGRYVYSEALIFVVNHTRTMEASPQILTNFSQSRRICWL
jgi:ATP-dependent Clp protease ATP-binding subunit ClpB